MRCRYLCRWFGGGIPSGGERRCMGSTRPLKLKIGDELGWTGAIGSHTVTKNKLDCENRNVRAFIPADLRPICLRLAL